MRAVVRRLHSPDVDLDSYSPEDPAEVGVLVQVIVGPRDGLGEESFDVIVCTPQWLSRTVRLDGPVIGRHHLIVERWNLARIQAFLTKAVEAEHASNWEELGTRIGRLGRWEFDDYRP